MRLKFLILAAAMLMPAAALAQDASVPSRIDRLEQEVRALQRKVFPGASDRYFEPEIKPQEQPSRLPGSTTDITIIGNLMTRVDALEGQLARLTGQVEERGNQMRQYETQLTALQARLAKLESAPAATPSTGGADVPVDQISDAPSNAPTAATPISATPRPAASKPATPKSAAAATPARQQAVAAIERPKTSDAADDSYIYGYRLWEAGFYPEAQAQLAKTVKDFPRSTRASHARNLLGRAYLDDGKPATSAQYFLENYQKDPRGERAADSLYFLGQALTSLNKTSEACQAYAELADVYPDDAKGRLAGRVTAGKAKANCK